MSKSRPGVARGPLSPQSVRIIFHQIETSKATVRIIFPRIETHKAPVCIVSHQIETNMMDLSINWLFLVSFWLF